MHWHCNSGLSHSVWIPGFKTGASSVTAISFVGLSRQFQFLFKLLQIKLADALRAPTKEEKRMEQMEELQLQGVRTGRIQMWSPTVASYILGQTVAGFVGYVKTADVANMLMRVVIPQTRIWVHIFSTPLCCRYTILLHIRAPKRNCPVGSSWPAGRSLDTPGLDALKIAKWAHANSK